MAKKKRNTGLPPGSARYTGSNTTVDVAVSYVEYDVDTIRMELDRHGKDIILHPSVSQKVQWYDVLGLHDDDLIRSIGERFQMHPLALEDAVDVYQRPSYTEYEQGHFFTMKAIHYDRATRTVARQSVALYFGDGFLLTFQEHDDDLFVPLRQRLEASKGRIRTRKADYLAYAIIDHLVDQYYHVLDEIEGGVERLEESISTAAADTDKENIYALKKEVLKLRKAVAPLREALNMLTRSDSTLIADSTHAYLRDVYDHTIQILDSTDSQRDVLSGLQDLYISEVSLKMNKIMQFLTVVTAIFVPLSFLTGLYGMNFAYMPELQYRAGYFVLWGVMLLIALGMLFYFWKKRWL